MPKIAICFVWHMHQPLYKDLASGEYRLPWARLHALKDYYGMVKILEEFPHIHATFNLAPSLLVQIEEYASGTAADPFLAVALKPAEELSRAEKEFALRYLFQANENRLISRYPRYRELFDTMQQNLWSPQRAAEAFDTAMLRDLQVLSQIAWLDEEMQAGDPEVRELVRKGRNYAVQDQHIIARKQRELLQKIIPIYRDFAARGQIELSASPFYHPILPLLCDSNIASVSHPYLALPPQFAYPEDAEEQLLRARDFFASRFGKAPDGLWPSEGSVSDAALAAAARTGFRWAASDDEVLARTLHNPVTPAQTYRAYLWRQGRHSIRMVFRDHFLSDLIGFAYQRMDDPAEAASHFLAEVRKNCHAVLQEGRDALVPVILDGENAWEYYFQNGRPFLGELYRRISTDPEIEACTVSQALRQFEPEPLDHVFPGSWIDANFDIWIGAEEDNRAWEQLLLARKTYDEVLASERVAAIPAEALRLAREELLIAEGSDWCWWYGPEHSSANKSEFDQLCRGHLANVYRLLGLEPPPELAHPILREAEAPLHEAPAGLIQPVIDGMIGSASEWADAGRYRVAKSGAMHSQRPLIRELYYGTSGENIYLRVDLNETPAVMGPATFRFALRNRSGERFEIDVAASETGISIERTNLPEGSFDAALAQVFELRVSIAALHMRQGDPLYLQLFITREDLVIDSLPFSGELELYARPLAASVF
jgi:alpha-amylase/alpha-mannosidase (GH57 family)